MNQSEYRLSNIETLLCNKEITCQNDTSELLKLARRFSKIENDYVLKHKDKLIEKKIAFLSPYSVQQFIAVLRLYLLQNCIYPKFYVGAFNNIEYEIMDVTSGLYKFAPDIIFILTDYRDIKEFPKLFASKGDIDNWGEQQLSRWQCIWDKLKSMNTSAIFHLLYTIPLEKPFGNLEANYIFSQTFCLQFLNQQIVLNKPGHVTLVDMDCHAAFWGKGKWFDKKNYFISKQGFSFDAIPYVAGKFTSLVSAAVGKTKKCLVLDLDNTLWGGIIGDDGIDGINLDPNNPIGEAYISFQSYLKKLKDRGVMLAVCSKNNEDIARQPFLKHKDMVLKLDDICCFVANWEDKVSNIRSIARNLNIGLDSLVFMDDNPSEREIVRRFLPEVSVVPVGDDPALYTDVLDKGSFFDWMQLTKEDIVRTETYVANVKREDIRKCCHDYDSFLQSLDMEIIIDNPAEREIPRFTQLINKTNQFNLRTRRYGERDIEKMMEDPANFILFYGSMKDKFSSFGIITCVILKKIEYSAYIDTWVMSCRVFNKGVEHAMFNYMIDKVRQWPGVNSIIGEYKATEKNDIVRDFLPSLKFIPFNDIPSEMEMGPGNGDLYIMLKENLEYKKHFIKCMNKSILA